MINRRAQSDRLAVTVAGLSVALVLAASATAQPPADEGPPAQEQDPQTAGPASAELPGYSRHPFELPPDTAELVVVDANADGRPDLLSVRGATLDLYLQARNSGFDFGRPQATLELPGEAVGWDISFNYSDNRNGESEAFAIIALVDGDRVSRWHLESGSFAEAIPVHTGLSGFLGHGAYRLRFSRDINNDGLDDLVIPGAGTLELIIHNQDGSYQPGISVQSDMQMRSNLEAMRDLEQDVGQSLRIPMMELRDVNNDGRPDLLSRTPESFDVFLANAAADNAYFPSAPTYSVDRTEIRQRLGAFDVDQLDFSNLTGVLALTHEELLEDVDNDGIADFVLREGGKVSLFMGTEDGMDFSAPRQILRSGGNVLTTFLHDEDGDGLNDLWLWRIESVSVGDVFLWLAVSGSIDIEAFIYPNDGNSFSRRPSRRLTVSLRFPSAVRVMNSVMDLRREARDSSAASVVPTTTANVLADGGGQDLLALMRDRVDVFVDTTAAEEEADPDRFLASLGYSRDRDNYEIDIRSILEEFQFDQNSALDPVAGRSPDYSVPMEFDYEPDASPGALLTVRLNGDELDDIFVLMERDSEAVRGVLLLSQ